MHRAHAIYRQQATDEQALLGKPIADLNLSVRARKCMIRLGVSTIGELVRRTGDELLECKNFGVTSLNEVREKLTTHGLKLRGDTQLIREIFPMSCDNRRNGSEPGIRSRFPV